MLVLAVYSFTDVAGSINGPGGQIPFGMGYGLAEEGITFEQIEAKNKMMTGVEGNALHSMIANDAAKCTIHVLKTSPLNASLNAMYEVQKANPGSWGTNVITTANPITGDQYTGSQGAFKQRPANSYAKDPNQIAWEFDIGTLYVVLGGPVAAAPISPSRSSTIATEDSAPLTTLLS